MRGFSGRFDRILAGLIAVLVIGGCLIFASAAVGLVARGATHISSVAFNHIALGLGIGLIALSIAYSIDYRIWRTYAPHLFAAALILTALVFVPGLGFEHGGGKRWLDIFGFSLQPSEFLKVAIVIAGARYFADLREKMASWRALAVLGALLAPPAALLILQPDIGTLGIVTICISSVFLAAGARWRDIAILVLGGVLALGIMAASLEHVRERIVTFINPADNPKAEGYQIRQSLIAIGSGGLTGRGFGQGVQKFTYLPEPMGDSIFAVSGEELGFTGTSFIVLLYLFVALRGFAIAARAPDLFGGLLAVGLSTYLVSQAFINMAAMLGMVPLTGIPLTFVSQGGSAALVSLGAAGLLLGVARRSRIRR